MEFIPSIVFSGNKFTSTSYQRVRVAERETLLPPPTPRLGPDGFPLPEVPAPPPPPQHLQENNFQLRGNQFLLTLSSESERNNARIVRSFTSTGIRYYRNGQESKYEYEHDYNIEQIIGTGTFSLTDDRIEFVFSDNTVVTRRFSHTENTLHVGGSNFVRSGFSR
jgi:hypothetical protein